MGEYEYTYQGDEYYCYPGTTVLKNKLDIRDADALNTAERKITSIKIAMLLENPVKGDFGFTHFCEIHRFIFCDVYDWAGHIRQGEFLMKGNSIFCRGKFIKNTADDIFGGIIRENRLCGLDKARFVERMAYLGEVNALHPFREGNGRTAREFFRELASNAGYALDFRVLKKEEHLDADIRAFNKDYVPLVRLLNRAINNLSHFQDK